MSDVMCDAMVVERARYEDTHLKGEMQVYAHSSICSLPTERLTPEAPTALHTKDRKGFC